MPLTKRQISVIRLTCKGKSRKEIGWKLGISRNAVDDHLNRIHRLVGFHDPARLTRYALAHGIFREEPGYQI